MEVRSNCNVDREKGLYLNSPDDDNKSFLTTNIQPITPIHDDAIKKGLADDAIVGKFFK